MSMTLTLSSLHLDEDVTIAWRELGYPLAQGAHRRHGRLQQLMQTASAANSMLSS